jgi:hypothetical protein
MIKVATPLFEFPEETPEIVAPDVSDKLTVEVVINKLLSSPFKVTVTVKAKFFEGLALSTAALTVYTKLVTTRGVFNETEAIVEAVELAVNVKVPAERILKPDKVKRPPEVSPVVVPLKVPVGDSDKDTV